MTREERQSPTTIEGCRVVKKTDGALLIAVQGGETWIPKSLIDPRGDIDLSSKEGDRGDLVIPLWLAEDRGLDHDL